MFKGEIPKSVLNEPKSYNEFKLYFLEYVKTNIVKSYLRFNMTEVAFKESLEPTDDEKMTIIEKIQK